MGEPTLPVAPGPPASSDDLEWEALARRLKFDALTTTRTAAEKWATTIGSVTGIFGVVALIKGPDDITKVEGDALGLSNERWAVVLLVAAVILALLSTLLAALASQGWTARIVPTGARLREWTSERATTARRLLFWSRALAPAAVLLVLAAVILTWTATPASPAQDATVRVAADGEIACGALRSGQPGEVRVQLPGQEQIRSFPLGSGTAVTVVESCSAD